MAVMPGPVMAGTCSFEISVRGHGCHAAMPNQGVDTLVVASQLVLALQTIVSRNLHPCESAGVSVTQIHGGEAWNVIPDDAVLRGTIRSFKPEIQSLIESAVERLCAGIGITFGAEIGIRFDQRYPPTVNSEAETAICQASADTILGTAQVRRNELPSMGAEDFAYMLQARPGCYVWLGNGPGTGGCSLHNPHYDFNDTILPIGISYWVRLAQDALRPA
jgi:hippurate hydrolase